MSDTLISHLQLALEENRHSQASFVQHELSWGYAGLSLAEFERKQQLKRENELLEMALESLNGIDFDWEMFVSIIRLLGFNDIEPDSYEWSEE